MSKLNTSYIPKLNSKQLTLVTGKAGSFVFNYFVSNYEDYYQRLEDAFEAVLYTLLDEPSKANSILEQILKKEENESATRNVAGFDSESEFGKAVEQFRVRILSEPSISASQSKDAAAMAVSIGYALKIDGLQKHGYYMFYFFTRLFNYLSFKYHSKIWMNYEEVKNIFLKDVGATVQEIKNETPVEGKIEEYMTSFAFEDFTSIFAGDSTAGLMKDSELQAYEIYAELIYSDLEWKGHDFCQDVTVPIKNEYGKVTGFQNVGPVKYPCIDEAYNIAPITGTILSRTTVEAPPVQGAYSSEAMDYIEKRLIENYPRGAFYGDGYERNDEYKHADGTWVTTYTIGNNVVHYAGDASHYEAYSYVNHHETRMGSPWPGDSIRYGLCTDYQGNNLIGFPYQADCFSDPNQCSNFTGPETEEECNEANGLWKFSTCKFISKTPCITAGGTWNSNNWEFTDAYEITPPPAFPNVDHIAGIVNSQGSTNDMSLRHHILDKEAGSNAYWWNDFSIIQRTGFALVPLEFSQERLDTLYSDYKVNPVVSYRNVGRRAFAATTPTVGKMEGHVGPPQPFYGRYGLGGAFLDDMEGGPFAHAQVYVENETNKQNASITLTPGWMWKFICCPDGKYHTMETGGWNIPLSQTYTKPRFASPIWDGYDGGGAVRIEFESSPISNDYQREYISFDPAKVNGPNVENDPYALPYNEVHPSVSNLYEEKRDHEGRHNQTLTPNRFFGMGDCSQDYSISGWNRNNAGYAYTFHSVLTGGEGVKNEHPTGRLSGLCNTPYTVNSQQTLVDLLKSSGAEGLYSETILGSWGEEFYHDYVSGYIFTGEEHAGETVSCMYPWNAYSTTSDKTFTYWYLEPDTPSYFPWSGFDNMWASSRFVAPEPNISKCAELFPTTTTTAAPTTTTTAAPTTTTVAGGTTTTDGGLGTTSSSSTTTSTTIDPLMEDCTNNPKTKTLTCYDDFGNWDSEVEVCNFEQCSYFDCGDGKWDEGIYPEDRGWAKVYNRQRGENPARYWRGPFASTHFKFLYPHASGGFNQYFEETLQEEDAYSHITGFPTKIKFKVKVHEWISKDICSGGYVDSMGNILLTHALKTDEKLSPIYRGGGEGPDLPSVCTNIKYENKSTCEAAGYCSNTNYTTKETCEAAGWCANPGGPWPTNETDCVSIGGTWTYETWTYERWVTPLNIGLSWPNLVDSGYGPPSQVTSIAGSSKSCSEIVDDPSKTRNILTYDQMPTLCAGNKIGTGQYVDYVGSVSMEEAEGKIWDAINGELKGPFFNYGGYYGYSGYEFEQIATYAKPTYSLLKYASDYSSIIDALAVGNEAVYYCGYKSSFYPSNNPDTATALNKFDPIYFLPMDSDDGTTGSYAVNYPNCNTFVNPLGCPTVEGKTVHPHKIYGDHWVGLRSGCLADITGQPPTTTTPMPMGGATEEGEGLTDPYGTEAFCTWAKDQVDLDLNYEAYASDKEVFLFNISHTGVDIHFRRPALVNGFNIDVDECGYEFFGQTIMELGGCPIESPTNKLSLTGTAIGGGLKMLSQNNEDFVLNVEKEIVRNEGVLFEKPTGEWCWRSACSDSQWKTQVICENEGATWGQTYGYWETLLGENGHAARLARGISDCVATTTINPMGGTSTTAANTTTTTEEVSLPAQYVKVSGWREVSKIKIFLYDFEIYGLDKFPKEDQFRFQQSGDCTVTGYLEYKNQEEASIYSEGIVVEDTSHDPLLHVIDYPHYASDVLNRSAFSLPADQNHPVELAPSRMLTRFNVDFIEGVTESGGYMLPIKTEGPHFYNRYLWPTISDVHRYNGGHMSWESVPKDDGYIFPPSQLLICGEAGQPKDVEEDSDHILKQYTITQHWAIYDSMVVDPMINEKYRHKLKPPVGAIGTNFNPAGGYIVPAGTTVWDIHRGFANAEKKGEKGYERG